MLARETKLGKEQHNQNQKYGNDNKFSDKLVEPVVQTQIRLLLEEQSDLDNNRRDVPVGVPLDLSTPTRMSCIGTYGENCNSDNVSKYRVLSVAFHLHDTKN